MAENVRAEVIYSGAVQGVGFRYTARQTASRYDIGGYVQNLSNGTVRVVVEGARPEVEAFLGDLAADMSSYIDKTDVQWRPAAGEFADFRVHF